MVETVKILRKRFYNFGYPKIVRADDGPSFCWPGLLVGGE